MPGRGGVSMKKSRTLAVSVMLLLLSRTVAAKEVVLPAPVLEWSVYILLIFAVLVVGGISIFMKRRTGPYDTLDSLLDQQNPIVHSVHPNVTVTECVRRMNDLSIGAMLVMEDGQLLGIFTERDAMTRVLGTGLDPTSTNVSGVMTKDLICVSNSITLEEAMSMVTNHHIRHLPVLENDKVLGVVSSGDLTRHFVEN